MREIVLGTAGHVDHGKTSLVRALSGIETDRLKEEKKRGITIELGFAFLDLPCGHRLGIVDVPGHERFVKNMVAGAAGVDLIAFVIAADEGIMPQTREHFEICSLLGVKRGLIVITKIDMVEEDWLEMVQEEVREFFNESFLEDAPMVCVSSTTGKGIDLVVSELDKLVSVSDFSQAHGPFRLPVDRIFSMKGFGAVVTGTSVSGCITVGSYVTIYPSGRTARIRGIQVHSNTVEQVEAGHRTAINLQGLEKEFVGRGDILASPNSLDPSYMLDCDFTYLSSNEKPLKNRTRVRIHLGTAEIMGRIVLLDVDEAMPGERINVQVLLEEPVATWPGDYYVVRCYSPVYTIGGGTIFNNKPGRKRRRFKDVNSEIFKLYRKGSEQDQAIFHLTESAIAGMTFNEMEVRLGIFGNRLKKLLSQPISSRRIVIVDSDRQLMVSSEIFEKVKQHANGIIEQYHKKNPLKEGIAKEELRSQLFNNIETRLFSLVIASLVKDDIIVQEQAFVRLVSHEVSLQEDAEELRNQLDKCFKEAGLKPPTKKALIEKFSDYTEKLLLEILDVLLREEIIVKVSEDLLFSTYEVNKLQEKLITRLQEKGEVGAPDFKEMTGLSRKFFIPLMEFFDKQKVTIRVGDKRILREKRN